MAQISSTVLQGLAQPSFGGGMFELGSALGGIPAQRKEKQKQEKFNEIMKLGQAAMAQNDPVNLSRVSQQLAALGYTKEAQQFSAAAQQAEQKMKQTEGAQGLMSAISGETGFTPEVEQSLIVSGVTPSQILAGKEERRSQEARKNEKDALGSLSSAALIKSAQNKDPVSSEAYVRSLIDTQDVTGLREFLSKEKDVGGSKAAPAIRSLFNEKKGYHEDVAVYRDDEGDIVTQTIGRSEVKDKGSRDNRLDTATGMKIYSSAVEKADKATEETNELREILRQAEDLAGVPLGGLVGEARTFLISDVAGLAGKYSLLTTKLNKQQMMSAIALLPRGPASDRDVALALNASPNLKDYSAEERISILRGMVKLKEAQERHAQERRAYMTQTGDPLALGYEEYSQAMGLSEQRIAFEQDYSAQVNTLKEMLRALPEDSVAAEQALEVIRQVESDFIKKGKFPASYLSLLENENSAVQQWKKVKKINDIPVSLL
jgi:hypothetical protein